MFCTTSETEGEVGAVKHITFHPNQSNGTCSCINGMNVNLTVIQNHLMQTEMHAC